MYVSDCLKESIADVANLDENSFQTPTSNKLSSVSVSLNDGAVKVDEDEFSTSKYPPLKKIKLEKEDKMINLDDE